MKTIEKLITAYIIVSLVGMVCLGAFLHFWLSR